jgi:hypothetical protein
MVSLKRYKRLKRGKQAMTCKFCGLPVEEKPGGHRQREYCNDAHRQAYWRQQHQQDQTAALLVDLEQLRALVRNQARTIKEQAQEIDELSSQITTLRDRLDYERRYLADITPRRFKGWLKKQPSSPRRDRFLSDQSIELRGPRSYYEAQVKRLHCSEEEHEDFIRLWKLMLSET